MKISIITVVKNGLPFLKSAIQSIKSQSGVTNKDLEHIIVCSPSSDGTEKYLKKTDNIKLIFDDISKNKFGSINLGIQHSSGDIIGLLHADDIFYDHSTISTILNNFNEQTDIIYGDILFSEQNDLSTISRTWVSSKFSIKKLKRGWMPPHTSIFVKKKIILNYLYETNFPISGDYLFILKLFKNKNLQKKYLNKYIVIMRNGGDSTKISNILKKVSEDIKILQKFFKFPILVLLFKILSKINQFKIVKLKINTDYIKKLQKLIN